MAILSEITKGLDVVKNFAQVIAAGDEAITITGKNEPAYTRVESTAAPLPAAQQTADKIAGVPTSILKTYGPYVLAGGALSTIVWLAAKRKKK